jgi:hypothetical protein
MITFTTPQPRPHIHKMADLAPPPEGAFPTYEDLFSHLQDHAGAHDYAVAVGRSKRERKGIIRTRYIQCVKSGKPRNRVTDRKRPLISQKTECPFRCRAHRIDGANGDTGIQWELTVVDPTHNHDLSDPIAHYQHHKFSTDVRQQVASMTKAGVAPKQISATILHDNLGSTWTMQDIYNLRRELRAELLEGQSPIEAMLYELEVGKWEFNYQLDDNGHITQLFFTHPESLSLLKQYPEVLLMDCTYKTNRFRMPLLDILGSTSLNRTFFTAFVFLSGEKEGDYLYALKMLQEVMNIRGITFPEVIVTDKEQALMGAISLVFPQSYNLLYGWHINKNVLAYSCEIKIHKKNSKEEEGFMAQ